MKDGTEERYENELIEGSALGYPGALQLDPEKYLAYTSEIDISEEQRIELLKMLWSIMSAFVDLGWGVDRLETCIPALKEFTSDQPKNELEQTQNDHLPFNKAASRDD